MICGIGVNDADYNTQPTVNGARVRCPYYRTWASMILRCYSDKYQEKFPTYAGCTVSSEWLSFMNFREWMIRQDWKGKHLDKDILVDSNKIYGPKFCVFVDRKTNTLLLDRSSARGDLPIGVSINGKGYRAGCNKDGKPRHIGNYSTPEQAHDAYKQFKAEVIMEAALRQPDIRVKSALFLRSLAMAYTSQITI